MVFSLFKSKPLISVVLTKEIPEKDGSGGLTQYNSLYTYESRLDNLQMKLQKIKKYSKKVIESNNLSSGLAQKECSAKIKQGKCKKKKQYNMAKLYKSKSMEIEDFSCGDQMTLNGDSGKEAECKEGDREKDDLCKDDINNEKAKKEFSGSNSIRPDNDEGTDKTTQVVMTLDKKGSNWYLVSQLNVNQDFNREHVDKRKTKVISAEQNKSGSVTLLQNEQDSKNYNKSSQQGCCSKVIEECSSNKDVSSLDSSNKKQRKAKKNSKASVSPTHERLESKKASVVYMVQTPVRERLAMLSEEGRIHTNTSEVYIQNSGTSSFNSCSNVLADKSSEQETVISAMAVSDIFEITEAESSLSSNNPKVVNTSDNIILNKANINKGTSETSKQKVVPLTHLRQETPQSNLLSSCYSIKPSEKNLICNSLLDSECKVPKNSELVSFEERNTQGPLILKLSEKEKKSITNVDRAINTEDQPLKTSNIELETLVTSKHHCPNRSTEGSSKVKPTEYLSRLESNKRSEIEVVCKKDNVLIIDSLLAEKGADKDCISMDGITGSFCSTEKKKSYNVISKTKKRKGMVRQLSSTDLVNKTKTHRSTSGVENAGTQEKLVYPCNEQIAMDFNTTLETQSQSNEYLILHCNKCKELCLAKIIERKAKESKIRSALRN